MFEEKRYRWLSRRLSYFDLATPDDEPLLDESTLVRQLEREGSASDRFLDVYSRRGLEKAFRTYGVWQRLEAKGFQPYLQIAEHDRWHMLRILNAPAAERLVEIVVKRTSLKFRPWDAEAPITADLIVLEWMLMQHPRAYFRPERPPLPGQRYPGLGLGRRALALLEIMAMRVGADGLLTFPEYMHNAVIYDRRFKFVDPQREGELHALERDLRHLSLAGQSWAVEWEAVVDVRTGLPYRWRPAEMVFPVSGLLRRHRRSSTFRRRAYEAERTHRFRLDEPRFAPKFRQLRRELTDVPREPEYD